MGDRQWKPYVGNRLIMNDPTGFYVIIPDDGSEPTPLCCPVCSEALRSREDEREYVSLKCCLACAHAWAHARRDAWLAGWRPSPCDVIENIANRPGFTVEFEVG